MCTGKEERKWWRWELRLGHYYRKGLHRRFGTFITDGFVNRLSLWVSDDMSHHRRFFKPSVIVIWNRL